MKTRGNLALVKTDEDIVVMLPGCPRPLLMNFLEELPGKVTKSPTMSDDRCYSGSTQTNGGEAFDYLSD